MYTTILLAAALQAWERYSTHALAARDVAATLAKGAAQQLDVYMAPLRTEGMAVSPILRVGNPREVIVEVAISLKAELLILGSHSKRGLLDIMLGGTAQQVSKAAPCLVVLVSPQPEGSGREPSLERLSVAVEESFKAVGTRPLRCSTASPSSVASQVSRHP